MWAAIVICYLLLVTTKSIKDVSILLSNPTVYKATNISFHLTLENDVKTEALMRIKFPNGFDLSDMPNAFYHVSGLSTTGIFVGVQAQTIAAMLGSSIASGSTIKFTLINVQNPRYSGPSGDFSVIFSHFEFSTIYDQTTGSNFVTVEKANLIGSLQSYPDSVGNSFTSVLRLYPTIPLQLNDIVQVKQVNTSTLTDLQYFDFSQVSTTSSSLITNSAVLHWNVYDKSQLWTQIQYATNANILNSILTLNISYVTAPTIPQTYYFQVSINTLYNNELRMVQSDYMSQLIVSVPDPPTNIKAVATGSETVKITFDAPKFTGYTDVTSYTAKPVGSNKISVTASQSPITMGGLTNGQSYYIQVVANNRVGSSAASISSASVTPATVPDTPTILNATSLPIGESIVVFLKAGSFNGGATLTQWNLFVYESNTSNLKQKQIINFNNKNIVQTTITGLTNGLSYFFAVSTNNKMGESDISSHSGPIIPSTKPDTILHQIAAINSSCVSIQYTALYKGDIINSLQIKAVSTVNHSTTISNNVKENVNSIYIWCDQLSTLQMYTFILSATNNIGTTVSKWQTDVCLPMEPQAPTISSIIQQTKYENHVIISLDQPQINYCLQTLFCIAKDISSRTNSIKGNSTNISQIFVSDLNVGQSILSVTCKNKVGWSAAAALQIIYVATLNPTKYPTKNPTQAPTASPTRHPSNFPTRSPSYSPSKSPTIVPSSAPTFAPTDVPTQFPTNIPTNQPTFLPTLTPSMSPTMQHTMEPTSFPTVIPSDMPTQLPTYEPTSIPTAKPITEPTMEPTAKPTVKPTNKPTYKPTANPSHSTSHILTTYTTINPTLEPTINEISTNTTANKTQLGEVDGDTNNNSDEMYIWSIIQDSLDMPIFYISLVLSICFCLCFICLCKKVCKNKTETDSTNSEQIDGINNESENQSLCETGIHTPLSKKSNNAGHGSEMPTNTSTNSEKNHDDDISSESETENATTHQLSDILIEDQTATPKTPKVETNSAGNKPKQLWSNAVHKIKTSLEVQKQGAAYNEPNANFDQIIVSPNHVSYTRNTKSHPSKRKLVDSTKQKNVSPKGTICMPDTLFVDDDQVYV